MPDLSKDEIKKIRTDLDARFEAMRNERYSWWLHWGQLAQYILPRRYRWLTTPNQQNRGQEINQSILDSTGTIAARVLAAGMMSGMTSPTRQWFNLRIEGYGNDEVDPVNVWLSQVRDIMMRVFQDSNFYNCIGVMYQDLAVFGTAPMLIHENHDKIIHCTNPCAGEYFAANNDMGEVGILYREFVQTVAQLVEWFGEDNVSKNTLTMFKRGGGELQQEIIIRQGIELNRGMKKLVPEKFTYREIYWEQGMGEDDKFLSIRGYYECPFICPRWDVAGNDAYGRSPGMDALGDIKQLQMETKRKAQVIDKMANPPMVADVELQNKPASTLPGGVTYLSKKEGVGFKPAYENFRPPVQELTLDIQDVRERIRTIFFNDLFMMFQQLQAEPRSAAAIDARREEKMVMLGPVLERLQTEAHDKIIDRTFSIGTRAGIFPDPPDEAQGKPIQVEYVSMLASAQKAVETAGIERVFQMVGNLAALKPEVMNKPNWEYAIEKYSALLGNDPRLLNDSKTYADMNKAQAQQQQQQYMVDMGQGAAKAGKTLSETEVGGGATAMEAILGTGGQ